MLFRVFDIVSDRPACFLSAMLIRSGLILILLSVNGFICNDCLNFFLTGLSQSTG